ncbi:hypothetical protein T4D_13767 [Trichinella pseudospiralis]|uniref:Uncharacterized protein n=1 Tax=Trichinella pseudospiralis TaxID=6337 RepID=A0A0V1F7X0_TRIPS|nr:hypothetical protein T4D_13767 [Trichinella pseudospiralis]
MKCSKVIRLDHVRASATCDDPPQSTQKTLDRLVRNEFQKGSSEVNPNIADWSRRIHLSRRQITHPLLERTRCHSLADSTRADNTFHGTVTTKKSESFPQCRKSLSHTGVQLLVVLPSNEQIHDHPFARKQRREFSLLFQLSSAKTSTDSQNPKLIQKGIETAQRIRQRFVRRILRSKGVDLLLSDPDSLSFLQLVHRQLSFYSS